MTQINPNETEMNMKDLNTFEKNQIPELQTQESSSGGCGSWVKAHPIAFAGIIVAIVAVVGLALGLGLGLGLKTPSPYKFHVHCPTYYYLQSLDRTDAITTLLTDNEAELKKLYLVSQIISTEEDVIQAQYCGFVRTWSGTCEDGFIQCSNPGPAFDVVAFQEINVVWVNNISAITDAQIQPVRTFSRNQCYDGGANELCTKKGKSESWRNKTYQDPINLGTGADSTIQVVTNQVNFPTSTHIHGLEVRPSYDGNPLSWYDNTGSYAVGFTSAEDPYLNAFPTFKPSSLMQYYQGLTDKPYKVNKYPNVQQPGSLWYHDHSMGTTSFNVRIGLHGFYLIRDPTAQADLPTGDYEKILFLYEGSDIEQIITDCASLCTDTSTTEQQQACYQCYVDHQTSEQSYMTQKPIYRNATYRFRILNGDFDTSFDNIQFQVHGTGQTFQYQVIGSDSALRKTPTTVSSVTLWPGERVDVLVDFSDATFTGDSETMVVNLVSVAQGRGPGAVATTTYLASYALSNDIPENKVLNITNIDVPWVDLSVPEVDSLVSKKRMRTLFSRDAATGPADFGINGHARYHQGSYENPQIGTIQDWYFVNFIGTTHPIHIHLIQFQMIASYSQKTHNQCFIYQLDFMLTYASDACISGAGIANRALRDAATYNAACTFIQALTSAEQQACMTGFANEGTFDGNGVSGIDVWSTCTAPTDCTLYIDNACTFGQALAQQSPPVYYKYVCSDTSAQNVPEYRKGWKQVAPVPGSNILKVRMRWTRTDYQQSRLNEDCSTLTSYQFFHIPEEDIIQFPGYLYHCHILNHEDKEMMRPMMMLPSRCHTGQTWAQRWQTINAGL